MAKPGRREVIAEGTPRVVLFVSLFVAIAAVVGAILVASFKGNGPVVFALAGAWLLAIVAFVAAAIVASRRAGVSAPRVAMNAVRAAAWFAFSTMP